MRDQSSESREATLSLISAGILNEETDVLEARLRDACEQIWNSLEAEHLGENDGPREWFNKVKDATKRALCDDDKMKAKLHEAFERINDGTQVLAVLLEPLVDATYQALEMDGNIRADLSDNVLVVGYATLWAIKLGGDRFCQSSAP